MTAPKKTGDPKVARLVQSSVKVVPGGSGPLPVVRRDCLPPTLPVPEIAAYMYDASPFPTIGECSHIGLYHNGRLGLPPRLRLACPRVPVRDRARSEVRFG